MSSTTDLQQEENALKTWPRRLLHVPTMTSYEWQPGNVYGPATAPQYNAITYTWGRWRLDDHEQPKVPPICIHGVPWKIPRVDPSHFTAAHLEMIIQRVTQGISNLAQFHSETLETVDFIWIDIACIDQRANIPTSTAEIGRQAMIFDRAKHVFAWLGSTSNKTLSPVIIELDELCDEISGLRQAQDDFTSPSSQEILQQAYNCFQKLFQDRWFSSLWTLQEAFLRCDAVIMSQEGIIVTEPHTASTPMPLSKVRLHADLYTLISFCERVLQDALWDSALPTAYKDIMDLLINSGLAALASANSLSVYTATSHRTCVKDEDRIYGIQQIFGARVGTSSLSSRPGLSYTRAELEIQLGDHLLQHYPVLSQLHLFTEKAPLGLAWLVSPKSAVPPYLMGVTNTASAQDQSDIYQETPHCKLSTEKVGTITWGKFKGVYCNFASFMQKCTEFTTHELIEHRFRKTDFVTIHLDVTSELASCPEYRGNGFVTVPNGRRQEQLASWLLNEFSEDDLHVFLIGARASTLYTGSIAMIGLLVLQCRTSGIIYYHRIGLCWWDSGLATVGGTYLPHGRFINGKGSPWTKKKCLFG
ncbi:uncharacterized protein F4817DRAFT_348119 [Daldinia loculata]|uniref:uncharacterized protein n=1 Tax=Daldinia loculata TaxID=103429 RepID=UPI0020C4AA7E|nr:uncharacterized protein F4817DRAFT_348119 [Daldinia loculata]KAI1643985.1 hypothetical protein F4817DRAFT_348119 [Daldinia loculata]